MYIIATIPLANTSPHPAKVNAVSAAETQAVAKSTCPPIAPASWPSATQRAFGRRWKSSGKWRRNSLLHTIQNKAAGLAHRFHAPRGCVAGQHVAEWRIAAFPSGHEQIT